jgi:multiple sugar transport system substrate-binding protein
MVDTPQVNAIAGLLPHFEKTTGIYPVIEIVSQQYLLDRILQEQRETLPPSDIYMFDIPWLYYLASAGVLADITDYIRDPGFDINMFLPNCLKYFSEFEGKYYGLPFMYAPQIFYYRKDLFENPRLAASFQKEYRSKLRPPLTWTEFNAIAEFFTQNNMPENTVDYGISMPTAYKECMVPELYLRLWSYGGKVFDNQFNVTLDSPQALKAYINYKGAFKYAKPDYKTATDLSAVSDFINGKTAMLVTYPSFLTDIVDLRSSSLIGSIGYSHVPGRRLYWAGGALA